MNPVFTARKRAEEFSSMVDDPTVELGDTRYADLAGVLEQMTALREAPPAPARPEFVADLRSRLMVAAETALVPETSAQAALRTPTPRRTGRDRRIAVAVGTFAIVSASGSMAVAAQSSLPGDTLYPLKRAMENVHESVLRDADDKGVTMLGNASGRLAEVDELSRSGDQDAGVISQTLDDFAAQASEASDLLLDDFAETGRSSSIEELRAFAATSMGVLERLERLVPVAARGSLVEAVRILGQIDLQAVTACPTCGDLPLTQAPLDAVRNLGPMFAELVDTPLGDAAPAQPAPTKNPDKPSRPGSSGEQVDVTPDGPAKPPVEEPRTPALPGTGDTDGGNDDTPGDPLKDLVTGLNGGDVGDLLTGTVDAVDDLLGGGSGKP